jgi:3',5'-cyclic AMP phosphodiesterase CpdA
MHRFKDSDHSITLSDHLYNEFCKPRSRFRFDTDQLYIVVSGDIVYTASEEEYGLAQSFAKTLSERLNVPKEKIIFCPGNHDVDWTDNRTQRFDNYLEFLREFYGDDLFRCRYPRVKWDFKKYSPRDQPADIVSVVKFDDYSILFASFNSCVYETKQQHYGFVGEKQLRQIRDLLDEHADSSLLKIAVFHHHIHPYPEPIYLNEKEEHWTDLSTLRDGGLLEQFLEKQKFDVVLHGHKHKAQLRETLVRDENPTESLRPLLVCGAGSCGVASAELEHAVANQYQVLEFLSPKRNRDLEFLRVEWRELATRAGAEWITPKEWTLLG